jgi:hypothetical protein
MKILQILFLSVFVTVVAVAQDTKTVRLRRQQARSLLIALSTDARQFLDQTLRARSLARIADALWTVDAEQGRLLFRKAWEAAEVADQENAQRIEREIQQQKAKTGSRGSAVTLPPSIRREVLRLAAKHDRALGEEFLEKLKAEKAEAASAALRPGRLNESLSQRLGVAREMLSNGNIEAAIQFADPALTVVGMDSLTFLTELRDKDPVAADKRYAALLAMAATNPQTDANTVSLLSSYIFTPRLYMTFTGNGISTSQMASTIKPPEVTPELRAAFFQTAAAILLRPLPPPGQELNPPNSPGVDGRYMVIKRLLPFFEQYAPAEMAASLRGHLNALNEVVSESARRPDDEWLNKGVRPEKPAADREQALMDRLDRAKTAAERDSLHIQLASFLADKGDIRARDFASKIDDSEVRKQVQAYIDGQLLNYHVEKKQVEPAVELIRKGDLTHAHRAWALTRIAKVLVKTDRDAALQLVEDAANEARRLDVSDPQRAQVLVAVANALNVVDSARAWDATFDAVKAANSAEGFTGEDGELILQFQSKGQSSVNTNDVPDFDLEGIFKELANLDYERAVELARGFQKEGPRAVATIAIARAVLEPKKQAGKK